MTHNNNTPTTTKPKQTRLRISPQMREVLELMVHEGLPLPLAAQKVGMTIEAAKRAERRQHVRNLYNQMVDQVRKGAAQQAYLGIVHQSHSADNDRLKFDAKRWVAGVDGISPVQKVQGQHQVAHQFTGFAYPTLQAKDVTPVDTSSPGADDD